MASSSVWCIAVVAELMDLIELREHAHHFLMGHPAERIKVQVAIVLMTPPHTIVVMHHKAHHACQL
jgi:hypothetical protein